MFGRVLGFLGSKFGFAVRVYFRVSFCFVGIWFLKDVEFFVLGVGLGCLKFGRIQSFLGFRGLLQLGYILGLVTVVESLGYFGV